MFAVISARSFCLRERSAGARKNDPKLGELAWPGVDLDRSAVLLHDNVVTEGKPEPCPLTGRLGREKRIEHLFLHIGRNAGAVVANADLDAVAQAPGRGRQRRLVAISACLGLALGRRVETVDDQVEQHPRDLLRKQIDLARAGIE